MYLAERYQVVVKARRHEPPGLAGRVGRVENLWELVARARWALFQREGWRVPAYGEPPPDLPKGATLRVVLEVWEPDEVAPDAG